MIDYRSYTHNLSSCEIRAINIVCNENTFARMECDCTLRFGLKALIKSSSYTKESNMFLHFKHFERLYQVLRHRSVHVLVAFGNSRGLLFRIR